jgi:VIT1/CCC1 family predicted Fe2+/Mn2+ transporter
MANIRIREFVFGMQDGILSTVALATSIAVASSEKSIIIVAATAAAIAGTISMSTGSYLSSKAYLETISIESDVVNESLKDAITMGISFIIGASIPLIPHIIFTTETATPIAILVSLLGLFTLGYATGKITKLSPLKKGIEITIIGGFAAILAFLVGNFLPRIL